MTQLWLFDAPPPDWHVGQRDQWMTQKISILRQNVGNICHLYGLCICSRVMRIVIFLNKPNKIFSSARPDKEDVINKPPTIWYVHMILISRHEILCLTSFSTYPFTNLSLESFFVPSMALCFCSAAVMWFWWQCSMSAPLRSVATTSTRVK